MQTKCFNIRVCALMIQREEILSKDSVDAPRSWVEGRADRCLTKQQTMLQMCNFMSFCLVRDIYSDTKITLFTQMVIMKCSNVRAVHGRRRNETKEKDALFKIVTVEKKQTQNSVSPG